jgi:hypothetical protein
MEKESFKEPLLASSADEDQAAHLEELPTNEPQHSSSSRTALFALVIYCLISTILNVHLLITSAVLDACPEIPSKFAYSTLMGPSAYSK